jgi:hypothetical protein
MKDGITDIALKSSPPAAVTAWHYILGLPVEKWVAVATLIYVLLQAFVLVRDRIINRT